MARLLGDRFGGVDHLTYSVAAPRRTDPDTGTTAGRGSRAWTSVNGAAVTQASAAIPGVGLYLGLLRGVLGDRMRSPIDQSADLWDQIRRNTGPDTDDDGRVRLDRWELAPSVQAEIANRWDAVSTDTVSDLADTAWFRGEARRLYGFDEPGVDYTRPAETEVGWPG